MISFFKALPKHIKTAFLSVFRHLAMSLSASSAVTVTLILFSAFLMIAGNVSRFTNNVESGLSIHAILDINVKEQKDIDQVKKKLEAIDGVKKVSFSNKDAELELMINERGEDLKMYRGKENPLSHAFFISVKNSDQIKDITEVVKKVDKIDTAAYGGTSVSKMISMMNTVRFGGLVFVVLLTLLAVFLISNSIKMTIYARNSEIAIMRNVGATNGYIKVPFMIEGMLIGLIGAIIPCIVTIFGYQYLYQSMNGMIITSMFALQPISPFVYQICGALLAFGMLVGLVGSFFSTTKYLHWKR